MKLHGHLFFNDRIDVHFYGHLPDFDSCAGKNKKQESTFVN